MDNQRTLLIAALAFIAVLIWQAWQKDYVLPQQQVASVEGQAKQQADVPNTASTDNTLLGAVEINKAEGSSQAKGGVIRVVTDVYEIEIDTLGGSIVQLHLSNYPETKGEEKKVQLLHNQAPKTFVVESGLVSQNGESPNHHVLWRASEDNYVMTGDELRVPLTWSDNAGISKIGRAHV